MDSTTDDDFAQGIRDGIIETITESSKKLKGRYSDESIDQFLSDALMYIPHDRHYIQIVGKSQTPHQLVEIVELPTEREGAQMQLKLLGTQIERLSFPAPVEEGYAVGDRLWIPIFTVAAILHFARGWYTAEQVTEIFEGIYVYRDTHESDRTEFQRFFS